MLGGMKEGEAEGKTSSNDRCMAGRLDVRMVEQAPPSGNASGRTSLAGGDNAKDKSRGS